MHIAQKKLWTHHLKSFNKITLKLRGGATPNQGAHALIPLFKKCLGTAQDQAYPSALHPTALPILVQCSPRNRLGAKRGAGSLPAPHWEQLGISLHF